MARATSSLPVPLSPVMRTQASRGATSAMRLKTACMARLWPMISSGGSAGSGGAPPLHGEAVADDLLRRLGRLGSLLAIGGRLPLQTAALQRPGDGVQGLIQVER